MPVLTGATYAHRDAIRAAGGKWMPETKSWKVPKKSFDALAALVATPIEMVALLGETHAHRHAIKEAGGRWQEATATWLVPASAHAELAALVASTPKRQRPKRPDPATVRVLHGATYDHRGAIRAAGGWWVPESKSWLVPVSAHADLTAMIAAAQVEKTPRTPTEPSVVLDPCDAIVGDFHAGSSGLFIITRVSKRFYLEEYSSLGWPPDHDGWLQRAWLRPATEEEVAVYEARLAEQERQDAIREIASAASQRIGAIADLVRSQGIYPTGEQVDGEDLVPGRTYRRFHSLHLATDGRLWLVQENGMDGDCWAWSNVIGGIGYVLASPEVPALVAELRDLVAKGGRIG